MPSPSQRRFAQVDVFSSEPFAGNPVAVVLDAEGLDTEAMQRIASWTNLSETTFVLPPTSAEADYRVRIFTPTVELPFAGHPTLGSCHAWLEAIGGERPERIVQECDAGLVELRSTPEGLAFASPPTRPRPVEEETVASIAAAFGLGRAEIVEARWVPNGPSWTGLLLESAARVLELRPSFVDLDVGLVGFHEPGAPCAIEVRAFFPKDGALAEDPVTGSLNASLATWLIESGRLTTPYVACQGTAMERHGRVHVSQDEHGTIWIAGATVTRVTGHLT